MKSFVLFALCVAVVSAAVIPQGEPKSAAITKRDTTGADRHGSETKADSGNYANRETIVKAIKEHGSYSYIDELGDLRQISSIPEDFDPEAYRIPKHQSKWLDD